MLLPKPLENKHAALLLHAMEVGLLPNEISCCAFQNPESRSGKGKGDPLSLSLYGSPALSAPAGKEHYMDALGANHAADLRQYI